jgi:translation initiation factor IF-2
VVFDGDTIHKWPMLTRRTITPIHTRIHTQTTLLDALRKTKLAAGEAGGITQRLGAFHIPSGLGKASSEEEREGQEGAADLGITVLDTPGHAAFSAMRLNGALATDIVLLVVSASDGIQEQTEEVLRLVAQEGVALMVAVTKVDKLGGESEVQERLGAIEQELAARGVMSEALGGDVQLVPVSARKGLGLAELRERLMLQAEVLELRADRKAPGEGLLLDCYVDRGLGVVVNVLMRWGALQPGDFVVAGDQYGRVRRILDEGGAALERALPSMPVRVLGFKALPAPGQDLIVVKSEERAQAVAEARRAAGEQQRLEEAEDVEAMDEEDEEQLREILERNLVGANAAGKKTKAFLALQRGAMDDLLESAGAGGDGNGNGNGSGSRRRAGAVVVPFLVKADGKGTLDAVTAALAAYQSDVIRAEVVSAGCGAVTEGDLERALAAGEGGAGRPCTVLAFGVGFTHAEVGEQARRAGVAVRQQSVIYSLLDDVKATLQAHMPMERVETSVGKLEVQATFALTGRRRTKNRVAGCKVLQGSALSGAAYRYRVRRGDAVLCDDSAPATLYHFKEQVQEVSKGMECGLSLEAFGDFEAGDTIEVYTVVEKPRDLKDLFRY